MRINNNLMAMNAHRYMSQASDKQSKSLEKLSSGLAINSAADNAAGLAISEKMRAQINGLEQASSNAQDGISLIQTAEGALDETSSILQRMNELATQAANGTLSDTDRSAVKEEITALTTEIDRIASSTKFNGQALLDGTLGVQVDTANSGITVGSDGVTSIDISGAKASETYTITSAADGKYTMTATGSGDTQNISLADSTAGTLDFDKFGIKISVNSTNTDTTLVGAANGGADAGTIKTTGSANVNLQIGTEDDSTQQIGLSIDKSDAATLGITASSVAVDTTANAASAMETIQTAIQTVSATRAKLGATQNRLEHTINNLSTTSENLTASESRIRDVDMAKEMMEYTKLGILQQASQSMLAQANQAPEGVLQLLR